MKSHAHGPSRLRRAVAAGASIALAASLPLLGVTAANATDESYDPSDAPQAAAAALFDDGSYIVQLRESPVATYEGGVSTFSATADGSGDVDFASSQSVAYANHLESEQQDAATEVGVEVQTHYTAAFNGFAANLTGEQAIQLLRDRRVVNITPNEILQIQSTPATDYLELEQNFAQLEGGWEQAGEGVVVGVLDTGIAPENPLFAGEPLGTTPGGPTLVDGRIQFDKGDGGTFSGVCQEGDTFTADMCNEKLIGAQYFYDGWEQTGRPIGTDIGETVSPRDGNGHGSHTASTSAGNANVPITSMGGVDLGTMSGVAPAAKISSYKVCWEGPEPDLTSDDGCTTSDLLAGIDAAVFDGVDVINFSIGGGAATTVWDPIDQAFLSAAATGIFVSASAGNSGPGAVTADHAAPWYATVAAATVPNFEGQVIVDGTTINGASVTVQGGNTVTAELVYGGDIPREGATAEDAALCFPESLDDEAAVDKIVLCDRGETARVDKSAQAAAVGAVGSILVNVAEGESLDLDDHVIPTVHVGAEYRDQLIAAAASGETQVTLQEAAESTAVAPQVAGFSSRGPMLADGSDVIKPDVTAPGVGIIAAGANVLGAEPTFVFMSGTSMSAPHVTGLAAAYLGTKPNASPAEVKSVISTSAIDTLNADDTELRDAFVQGAGMVEADGMLNAGFYFEADTTDYLNYVLGTGNELAGTAFADHSGLEAIDPSDLNIHSIGIGSLMYEQTVTRTATALSPGTYTVTVDAPAGVDVTVEPNTLTFGAAGDEQEYTVTFTNVSGEIDAWAQGRLTWSDGTHEVRQPLAVRPLSVEIGTERIESDRTWDVQPLNIAVSYDGSLEGSERGLTPLTAVWDGVPSPEGDDDTYWALDGDGLVLEHWFEVAEGDELLAVTTSSTDSASDYDLVVYELVEIGGQLYIAQEFSSGQEGSTEVVEVLDPTPGEYLAFTYDYNDPQAEVLSPVTLSVGTVGVEPGVGDLTVTLLGESGAGDASTDAFTEPVVRGDYEAQVSWQGLEPGLEYYGLVTAAISGASDSTIVHVTPSEETPEPALGPIADQTVSEGTAIEDVSPALDDDTGSAEITVDGLPAGVTFADGIISGTPTETGTFEVTVTATHELGFVSVETFTITVNEPTDDGEPSPSAPEPTDPEPSAPAPSDSADPQPSEIPDDGGLPRTGADIATWLLLIAAAVALVGGGLVVAHRRRS